MIINNNELKFAEKVILIDAAYINKVTNDLGRHFGQVIERELPKADLSVFLECVAMDAGFQAGEGHLQVFLVYDKSQPQMDAFFPSDLKKELNDVAFKSRLGEFQLNTFNPSDMADKGAFFLESVITISASLSSTTILPWFMIITRSQMAFTSCIMCVDSITALLLPISEIRFLTSTSWLGSSPVVGSSRIRTFGSCISACASPTLWR